MSEINRNNKFFRKARTNYVKFADRPLRIPNYEHNYILLEEGYNVIWRSMGKQLQRHINDKNKKMVDLFCKADLHEVNIDVPLWNMNVVRDGFDLMYRLIKSGATVVPKIGCGENFSVEEIIEALMLYCEQNLTFYAEGGDELICRIAELMGIKCISNKCKRSAREVMEEFNQADDRTKNKLFLLQSNDSNHLTGHHKSYYNMVLMLKSGYLPPIDSVTTSFMLIHVIENLHADNNKKLNYYQHLVNRVLSDPNFISYLAGEHGIPLLLNHPSLAPYTRCINSAQLSRLKTYYQKKLSPYYDSNYRDPKDILKDIIRIYDEAAIKQLRSENDHLPLVEDVIRSSPFGYQDYAISYKSLKGNISDDVLLKIIRDRARTRDEHAIYIQPTFERYWCEVPTDNEELLEFLDYLGVKLPPPYELGDYSMLRISKMDGHHQHALKLLSQQYQYDKSYLLTVLRMANEGMINLNDYDHPIIKRLIEV